MRGPEKPQTPGKTNFKPTNTFVDFESLKSIEKELEEFGQHYNNFKDIVNSLDTAVKSHPDTSNGAESGKYFYGQTVEKTDIETDIAVMIGIASQKWSYIRGMHNNLYKEFKEYEQTYREHLDNSKYYERLWREYREHGKELESTEQLLENISVETYRLLGEQPSPQTKVLRPNSSQLVSSD